MPRSSIRSAVQPVRRLPFPTTYPLAGAPLGRQAFGRGPRLSHVDLVALTQPISTGILMESDNSAGLSRPGAELQAAANNLVLSALVSYLDLVNPGLRDVLTNALKLVEPEYQKTEFDRAAIGLAIESVMRPAPAELRLVPRD